MADAFDDRTRRDADLDEDAIRRAHAANPDRSVLESYSGREEAGGTLGERNDDDAFDDVDDAPPYPLDGSDDVAAPTIPGETIDGLDETEEEVRRQAEDRPLGPGPDL